MEGIIIDFDEKKTRQKDFYSNDKKIFKINVINVSEILISKGLSPGLSLNKYIFGYKHNPKIKPLYIKLPKNVCIGKTFTKAMTISSEINDDYFFEKYNKIWKKIEKLMGINFERKALFYNNTTCTTKIKLSPYSEDYKDIKIPRKEIIYKFSSIAILHSVITKDYKYYPQAYMEEYKYERVEEASYFHNYFDSDSDSDFEE